MLADTLRKNGFKIKQNTISYFEGKAGSAHQEIVLNKIGLEILEKYNYGNAQGPNKSKDEYKSKNYSKAV